MEVFEVEQNNLNDDTFLSHIPRRENFTGNMTRNNKLQFIGSRKSEKALHINNPNIYDQTHNSFEVINLKEILENHPPSHPQILSSNSSLSNCRFSDFELFDNTLDLRKSKSKQDIKIKNNNFIKKNLSVIN